MIDGIHKPEGQAQKPKSATWAQPIDKVYSASNPNGNSKAIHPMKSSSGRRSFLPVLLGILFLAILGVGGYWWYTNYYNVNEPIIAENNIMEEEKVVEEENSGEIIEEEQVSEEEERPLLVFPDDYFLTDDEVGFDIADQLKPYQIEDGLSVEEMLYDEADFSEASELWAQDHNLKRVNILAISFENNEALDKEIEKISKKIKSKSVFWKEDVYQSYISNDNNLIVIISSGGNSEYYKGFVTAYEKKLDSKTIVTLIGGEAETEANKSSALTSLENLIIGGEIFFDSESSYLGFCQSSSTIDLKNSLEQTSKFNCFDNEFTWSASIKTGDLYQCADSTNLYLEANEPAKSTSCLDLDFKYEGADLYSEETLLCYVMKNPSALDYYPESDLKLNHQQMINEYNIYTDEEKNNVYSDKCTEEQDSAADLNSLMLMMDKDGDGLRLYFEKFFGASDNNKDTDGDGYDDLTEVENGFSPVDNLP